MPDQVFQSPKGMHDILPEDHEYFTYIKKVIRHRARQAGYRRISTPVLEHTEVFTRSIGKETDIVQKEMYTFADKKGRSLTMKPEGTAGVVRAYIENGMFQLPQPVELFYIEPHFRYDRPQKGRFRQFWQFGFEAIGELDPALDAQIIQMAHQINEDLGIADLVSLQINSIGCMEKNKKCRNAFISDLQNFYFDKQKSLCADCRTRLSKNPLRVLDCKAEDCQILAKLTPKFQNYLCEDCKEFHRQLLEFLEELRIPFISNQNIVRGLDYYTRTVFEFWEALSPTETERSQNAIGGGGRYDGLIELMGGPKTPATGYAAGMERIISIMKAENIQVPKKDILHVFVAQLGFEAKKKCLPLITKMREAGLRTVGALGKGSIKAQMRLADKLNIPYTVIIGITEVREKTAIIRDMKAGSQKETAFDKLIPELVKLIGEKNLDKYSPGEVLY